MLEILTFTGVDEYTDLRRAVEISHTYPKVEFGVLVGSRTPEERHSYGNGIFPALSVVDWFKSAGERNRSRSGWRVRLAVHLCGSWAKSALHSWGPSEETVRLCEGFDRVQINMHADARYPTGIPTPSPVSVGCLLQSLPGCDSIIFQHRDATWDSAVPHGPRVEYLFDHSEGSGREAFGEWPTPPSARHRVGYAGGIGPDNIGQAMEFVDRYPESRLWLDMESRVRTDGRFDLDKVEKVCQRVWPKI